MFTCRDKKNTNCVWILSGDLYWGKIKWPLVFISGRQPQNGVPGTPNLCGDTRGVSRMWGELVPHFVISCSQCVPRSCVLQMSSDVGKGCMAAACCSCTTMNALHRQPMSHSSTAKHGDFLWGWVQLVDPDYNKSCLSLEKVWEEKRKL